LPDILNNINWIDLAFIILLLGIVYKGLRSGVGGQMLSLAGWIVLVFVSIGFYDYISEAFFGFLLQKWAKPLSFFALSVGVLMVLKVLERIFIVMSSDEMAPIERLGGALVAAARACMFFGLIGILLLLVPVQAVRDQATKGSRSCMFFVELDARIYSAITEVTGYPAKVSWTEVRDKILSVTSGKTSEEGEKDETGKTV